MTKLAHCIVLNRNLEPYKVLHVNTLFTSSDELQQGNYERGIGLSHIKIFLLAYGPSGVSRTLTLHPMALVISLMSYIMFFLSRIYALPPGRRIRSISSKMLVMLHLKQEEEYIYHQEKKKRTIHEPI
jgi:hypothetical protein